MIEVCKHGNLRRQCITCEQNDVITRLAEENENLQKSSDGWRGMAEKLATALESWDPPLPPKLPNETPRDFTDRLLSKGAYLEHRNRQCSIGYHDECTDQNGYDCKCPCHSFPDLRKRSLSEFRTMKEMQE